MDMAIYLDHNATTPLDPRVLDTMLPWLQGTQGNPSSVHRPGREARAALDRARMQVAALVSAQPAQVIFTGGGTEADNLALKGVCGSKPQGRVLVSAIEHAAVFGVTLCWCIPMPSRQPANCRWILSRWAPTS